jgi:hypothetical protein
MFFLYFAYLYAHKKPFASEKKQPYLGENTEWLYIFALILP